MNRRKNRWKGLVFGMIGSIAGLLAMRYYWNNIAPAVEEAFGGQENRGQAPDPLDDISLWGKQYREDESSTAALGRLLYQWITGEEPQTQELKTALSYLVHWGYGMLQGGIYGALRANAPFPDLKDAWLYATGLWLVGDEVVVPLLGLQSGPTAVLPVQHANRWGAHLAYGTGTALATQTLLRLF